MRKLIGIILGSAIAGGVAALGCAPGEPRPLDPEAFRQPRGGVAESPMGPTDQPAPVELDGYGVDLPGREVEPEPDPADVPGIADVERSIHPPRPAPESDQQRNAIPAGEHNSPLNNDSNHNNPSQGSSHGVSLTDRIQPGQYLTLGGVVAEVNGRPIFANDVIRRLRPLLAAEARKHDRDGYRIIAEDLIMQMVQDMVRDELLFAAAMRSLDSRDRSLADRLATNWRREQITHAKGSVEMARRRARENGRELEELVREQYREFMVLLFQERKVLPRIQVTVDQMRRYYDEHVETKFTEHAEVRFRLIKVDPRSAGSRAAARDRIEDLHQVAVSGAIDFAKLAGMENDDSFLKQNEGDVGWVWRGNYIIPEVERVVWETPVGEVTDIIDAGGAFYIAKVEEVKQGRVRPFDEREPPAGKPLTVQGEIRAALAEPQRMALMERINQELFGQAVVRPLELFEVDPTRLGPMGRREFPEMLQPALDIAMQNYPRWADSAQASAEGMPKRD